MWFVVFCFLLVGCCFGVCYALSVECYSVVAVVCLSFAGWCLMLGVCGLSSRRVLCAACCGLCVVRCVFVLRVVWLLLFAVRCEL